MDGVSIIIGLLGIVVTVILYLRDKSQTKESSLFYEYRLISEKNTIEKLRRDGLIKFAIVIVCCSIANIGSLCGNINFIPKDTLNTYQMISMFIMVVILIANTVFNYFIAFKKSEWIDKLIKNKEVSSSRVLEKRDKILLYYFLIAILIGVCIIAVNDELLSYGAYIVTLVGISIDAIFCSYVYTYLNLRLQFVVSGINVKAKYQSMPYREVHNYKISKGKVEIMIRDKEVLRKISFLETELEYIEKIINEDYSLLDTKFKDWIIHTADMKASRSD